MDDYLMKWLGDYCAGTMDEKDARELRKWLDISQENRDEFCKTAGNIRVYSTLASAGRLTGDFGKVAAKRRRMVRRKLLLRSAVFASAAAIVIIILCLRWHGTDRGKMENRIHPGAMKATLILADGRAFDLAGEEPGELTRFHGGSPADGTQDGTQDGTKNGTQDGTQDSDTSQHAALQSIVVPAGGEYRFTLADGTKVWLNSATRITYPTRFDGPARNVSLVGEAYFEVAEDCGRPFTVEFGDARLEVTGTRFGVTAYSDCPHARVTLEEGGVVVAYNGAEVALMPGTQAMIDKNNGTLITREVDTQLYTSWIEGVFEFEDMKLSDLVRQLSRWYDVEFRFAAHTAGNTTFTGVLAKYDDLNDALALIEKTSDLDFVIEGRTITFTMPR